jgi:hypothetical protein
MLTTYAQDYDMNAIPNFDALEQVRRYYGRHMDRFGYRQPNVRFLEGVHA